MPHYWVGDTDTSWDTSNNWASSSGGAGGAGVPTGSDAVIFDDQYTTANCTCDVAIDAASIDVQSTYDGTLDFADSAYLHTIAGNATFDGIGAVDLGNSIITVSGNWDSLNQTTWNAATSEVVLDGADTTILAPDGDDNHFYSLTINADVSVSTNGFWLRNGNLTVAADVTLTCDYFIRLWSGTLINNGTIALASSYFAVLGSDLTTPGVFSASGAAYLYIRRESSISAGTIDIPVTFYPDNPDRTQTISGDITFQDDVIFLVNSGQTLTIDNSGNHDLTFRGSISRTGSGTFSWTKGTGLITLSGTIDVDFDGEPVEDIEMDSLGTVTLAGDVTTDSFTGTDGTLDIDGNDLTTTGNFTAVAGTVFNDTTGGGEIIVGGNFDLNGISGTAITWNGPDLNVTGTADADWTDVTDSDARAGASIVATANCNDNGGNNGWTFGGVTIPALLMINGQIKQYVAESPNAPLCIESDGSWKGYVDPSAEDPLVIDEGVIRVLAGDETLLY